MRFVQQTIDVLVPKAGNVSDLLQSFQKRANLDEETMQHLRVWEVYSGRIYKELDEKFNVAGITDFVSLYIEKIPQEEIEMQEGEFKISCFNFDKEPSKAHGIPFKFVVKPVCIILHLIFYY
ncbi:hypothetical protein FQN50_000534 [Emmonsiellopsis sp. PD_5]|nr:hypothetical protein FQN50_000534 [Emmonsiellopsis sp. PD_5]